MIKNLLNIIDFFLRKNLKISKGIYNPRNEPKDNLLVNNNLKAKEATYYDKYKLNYLKAHSTRRNYLENLYTIELLKTISNFDFSDNQIKVLDVGAKNWFYAAGLYHFFKYENNEKDILLNGIEVDGYRLYNNFHSRFDYAKFYINNLQNTSFIVDNVLNHNQKYDIVTCFLPFVFKEPLLGWGLPLNLYNPEKITQKMYDLLSDNGELIIINQGKDEYEKQKEILDELNINYTQKGLFKSGFLDYSFERFILTVKKTP